jgi:hypothetical protein
MLDLDTLKLSLANGTVQFAIALAFAVSLYRFYTTIWRPPFPGKGVSLIPEGNFFFGASRFWSARWDFLREWSVGRSAVGFYVGGYQVINLAGEGNRIAFFENKEMDLGEGWVVVVVFFFFLNDGS